MTADQECCRRRLLGLAGPRDVRALGFITMELMQKHVKNDGAVGVDDLRRWPPDSNAVDFLSETTSASSVNELMRVSPIPSPWKLEPNILASITSPALEERSAQGDSIISPGQRVQLGSLMNPATLLVFLALYESSSGIFLRLYDFLCMPTTDFKRRKGLRLETLRGLKGACLRQVRVTYE
jgi:hypothetical protein